MTSDKLTVTRRIFVASGLSAAGLVAVRGPLQAADEPKSPAKLPEPIAKGQRIFICGHSFHVFIFAMLPELAEAAGIKDQEIVGTSRIGGSRVIQHWDVPDDKNLAKTALREGKVDVLTLAPIWLPDEGIGNFVKLAVKHNPNVRVLVQEFWLPNDEYEPVYPLQTRKKIDHDATDVAKLSKANDAYCRDIEDLVRALNKETNSHAGYVVPVGAASVKLRELLVAGNARGSRCNGISFAIRGGTPNRRSCCSQRIAISP
ncbi:MAG: hypothetical protein QM775_16890 [Pirellulales bacterium]